jgi:hypothetical protein
VLLLLGCLVFAQKPPEPGKVPDAPGSKKPADDPKDKDPTKASPKLKEVIDPPKLAPGAVGPTKLPSPVLRGRVIGKDRPPAVLLELEPKTPPALVSQGSTLSVGGYRLKVLEVTASEVRIEVAPLNEIMILR